MSTLEWIGQDKVVNHHLEVPYGAPGIVVMGSFPVSSRARSRKELLVPNLEFSWEAFSEKTGSRLAPVFFSSSSAENIFS